jgi:hypothetical protein
MQLHEFSPLQFNLSKTQAVPDPQSVDPGPGQYLIGKNP